MIQVLPAVPNFGSRLADVLGQAGVDISGGIKQRNENRLIADANRIITDPNSTAAQKYDAFSRLPKERQMAAGQVINTFVAPALEREQAAKQVAEIESSQSPALQAAPPPQVAPEGSSPQDQLGATPQPAAPIPAADRPIPGIGKSENYLRARAAINDAGGKAAKGQLEAREQEKGRNFDANEKWLSELSDTRRSLQQKGADYNRMRELSSRGNLPNNLSASLFSKNGELNDKYLATLSADAQEYLKLVVNQLRFAKDTYGARVTNFDAAKFLQGLPTFLNTPKGRDQILRGLIAANDAELLFATEVPKLVDEMGGSAFNPRSSIEKEFDSRYGEKLDALRGQTSRTGDQYKTLQDIPGKEGQRARNKKTGQVMVYRNGKWRSE